MPLLLLVVADVVGAAPVPPAPPPPVVAEAPLPEDSDSNPGVLPLDPQASRAVADPTIAAPKAHREGPLGPRICVTLATARRIHDGVDTAPSIRCAVAR